MRATGTAAVARNAKGPRRRALRFGETIDRVPITARCLAGCAVILVALAVSQVVRAQGVAVATLQVGVRVVRSCSINADSSAADAGANSSVRVVCARSALRALRISTGADAAEHVTPLVSAEPQRLAGGELIFTVPTAVVVTLDF